MDGSTDSTVVGEWCKSVKKSPTLSKLHTMYGILENSVKWEKSAENMVRKIGQSIQELTKENFKFNFFPSNSLKAAVHNFYLVHS